MLKTESSTPTFPAACSTVRKERANHVAGRLERGETNMTFDYIIKIAKALRVKPSTLFDLIP
jgi:hypothetical protein